jgi:putative heme-binding domain-containing protein
VAGEYATILVETASGAVLSGRIEREDDQVLVLRPPSTDQSVVISKNEIVARKRSDLSNMPPGIVNVLRKEQVLDLLAYLLVNKGPNDTVPP